MQKSLLACSAALLVLVTSCSDTPETPLQEVVDFGANPGELRMWQYIPSGRSSTTPKGSPAVPTAGETRDGQKNLPLVVALHGCLQDAPEYARDSGWIELAERWGFLLLLPEQRHGNNLMGCFNWFSSADQHRNVGEALSIRLMIDRMQRDYAVDPQRIYVTGVSAGAAMSVVLMAVYPELFAGGAPIAGVAFGCADGLLSALSCMRDPPDQSAPVWGAAVRSATHHKGAWPRVSVWQGEADSAVDPGNATAIVRQWTDVHGVGSVPTLQQQRAGYRHVQYQDANGRTLVESYWIKGMGHGVPVDPGPGKRQCGKSGRYFLDVDLCSSLYIARFWGLMGDAKEDRHQ